MHFLDRFSIAISCFQLERWYHWLQKNLADPPNNSISSYKEYQLIFKSLIYSWYSKYIDIERQWKNTKNSLGPQSFRQNFIHASHVQKITRNHKFWTYNDIFLLKSIIFQEPSGFLDFIFFRTKSSIML